MTMSSRDRRDWRIIIWIVLGAALISAVFGLISAQDTPFHGIATGVASAIAIATPIVLFELKGQRLAIVRRLRRQPLWIYFAIRVVLYIVVILIGLGIGRLVIHGTEDFGAAYGAAPLLFSVAMSVLTNLVFEFGYLLGFRTLRNLLTGRYVRPRRELRVFLLIDMKNSTGVAERLGPIRFHELLNDFFGDISDAALQCDAEIHKYVGDEAILTWPADRSPIDDEVIACPFVASDFIAGSRERYHRRFGVEPQFRAALHCGEIVAGQIGDVRREIAYVGDTMNVAARLLEAAKEVGRDVLVSVDLLDRTTLPAGIRAELLPTLEVRGRETPLGIAALSRT
jgi:adenylate cyclase